MYATGKSQLLNSIKTCYSVVILKYQAQYSGTFFFYGSCSIGRRDQLSTIKKIYNSLK